MSWTNKCRKGKKKRPNFKFLLCSFSLPNFEYTCWIILVCFSLCFALYFLLLDVVDSIVCMISRLLSQNVATLQRCNAAMLIVFCYMRLPSWRHMRLKHSAWMQTSGSMTVSFALLRQCNTGNSCQEFKCDNMRNIVHVTPTFLTHHEHTWSEERLLSSGTETAITNQCTVSIMWIVCQSQLVWENFVPCHKAD